MSNPTPTDFLAAQAAKRNKARSRNAVVVAERFAMGEATSQEMGAARGAAWAAAAARDAAWAAQADHLRSQIPCPFTEMAS